MSKLVVDAAMKRRAAKKTAGQKANSGSGDQLDDLVQRDDMQDTSPAGNEHGHSERVKNMDRVARIMGKRKGK